MFFVLRRFFIILFFRGLLNIKDLAILILFRRCYDEGLGNDIGIFNNFNIRPNIVGMFFNGLKSFFLSVNIADTLGNKNFSENFDQITSPPSGDYTVRRTTFYLLTPSP